MPNVTDDELIRFIWQFPGVLEVTVVGDAYGEICVQTSNPEAADTVRAGLTIAGRDVRIAGSQVFVS